MRIVRSCGVSTIAACLSATRRESLAAEISGDRPEAMASSEVSNTWLEKDFCGETDIPLGEQD